MRRSALLRGLLTLIAVVVPLTAQEEAKLLWIRQIVVPNTVNATLIAAASTSDGTVASLMNTTNPDGVPAVHLARVESDGYVRWIRQVLGVSIQKPYARLLATDSAGGTVVVVVDSSKLSGPGCSVVRLDAFGQTSWSTRLPDIDPLQVAVSGSNDIAVWGMRDAEVFGYILTSAGAIGTSAAVTGSFIPSTIRLVAASGGRFAVSYTTATDTSIACVLYRSNGDQSWHTDFAGATQGRRRSTAVALDPSGSLLVAARLTGAGAPVAELMRRNLSNGAGMWSTTIPQGGPLSVEGMVQLPGRLLIAGAAPSRNLFVQSVTAQRDSLWRETLPLTRFNAIAAIGTHSAIAVMTYKGADSIDKMKAVIYGGWSGRRLEYRYDTLSFGRSAGAYGPNRAWMAGDVVPGGGGVRRAPTIVCFDVPDAPKIGRRLDLIEDTLDFGPVLVDQTAEKRFPAMVFNAGDSAMTIDEIRTLGEASAFTLEGITTPVTIPPFGSAPLTVRFRPTAVGQRSISVTFVVNELITPLLTIRGRGAIWSLRSFSDRIRFGAVDVNFYRDSSATIVNTGSEPLTIRQLSISAAAPFRILNAPTLPYTLALGAQVSFTVKFEPRSGGRHEGTLSVLTQDDRASLSIALEGEGLGPTGVDDEATTDRGLVVRPSIGSEYFEFSVSDPTAQFVVFDARGVAVRHIDATGSRGLWRGDDDAGRPCPSGAYYVLTMHRGRVASAPIRLVR